MPGGTSIATSAVLPVVGTGPNHLPAIHTSTFDMASDSTGSVVTPTTGTNAAPARVLSSIAIATSRGTLPLTESESVPPLTSTVPSLAPARSEVGAALVLPSHATTGRSIFASVLFANVPAPA